jgi:hypothetical protein
VTVAVRVVVNGLAVAVTATESVPMPVAGKAESHVWFEAVVQLVFDVTLNFAVLPFADATLNVAGETESVAAPANCVTVTVCEVTPLPETVTVAVRVDASGFEVAVTVTGLLPVPFAGLTESQVWLETAAQLIFDVILKVAVLPLAEATLSVFVETESVAAPANCVTVTVCEVAPVAEIVTVAVRVVVNGFDVAVTVTESVPASVAGRTESHDWFEVVVQLVFDVTLNFAVLPFADATLNVAGETESVVTPGWII